MAGQFSDSLCLKEMKMKRRRVKALLILCLSIALAGATVGCKGAAGSSPTATMKAFYEATRKKDVEAFKKTLSKGTLDLMDGIAKSHNTTLDETLKGGMDSPETAKYSATPQMRNEKIDGETATLEVQNDQNHEWENIPFVRENGEWKIALDKAIQAAQKNSSSQHDVK
jgi:flagellar hook-associated protein FlgK